MSNRDRMHNAPRNAHRRHDRISRLSGGNDSIRATGTSGLAPGEAAPGSLNDFYDVPTFTFKRNEARGLFISALLLLPW